MELQELAAEKGDIKHDEIGRRRSSLSELAKAVLGEELDFVKPRNNIERDSDEFYKYAATEAFLASKIEAKLLKSSHN